MRDQQFILAIMPFGKKEMSLSRRNHDLKFRILNKVGYKYFWKWLPLQPTLKVCLNLYHGIDLEMCYKTKYALKTSWANILSILTFELNIPKCAQILSNNVKFCYLLNSCIPSVSVWHCWLYLLCKPGRPLLANHHPSMLCSEGIHYLP